MNEWFGAARYTYNKCIDHLKENGSLDIQDLRSKFINRQNLKETKDQWLLRTPYEIRDFVTQELRTSLKGCFTKKNKGQITKFDFKFRSRKSLQQSIYIRSRQYKNKSFYRSFIGEEPLKSSEPLPKELIADGKLVKDNLNHYYLCVSEPRTTLSFEDESQVPKDKIVALDPGVRTFQTMYDPSGYIFEIAPQDIQRIYRLCIHVDKLQSKLTDKDLRNHGRYKIKKRMKQIRLKIRNLIKDCHCKLSKFLVTNYNDILLPSFDVSSMLNKFRRSISSKTARSMATWSHYRFKQQLLWKSSMAPWCKVHIVDESFTSKTCGNCGILHQNLGKSKIFDCHRCDFLCDRDINGARNIFLKNVKRVFSSCN